MVRSVEHQHRLRSLGYAAVLPSSHCAGFACDVEMDWFRRFDHDNLLARILLDRQEEGQLNVIDEGQAWHLCVNPLVCDELLAVYEAQLSIALAVKGFRHVRYRPHHRAEPELNGLRLDAGRDRAEGRSTGDAQR